MGAGTEGTLACIRERLASLVSHLSRSVLRGLVRGELCVLLAALSYSLTSHAQRIFLLYTLYICAFCAGIASTIRWSTRHWKLKLHKESKFAWNLWQKCTFPFISLKALLLISLPFFDQLPPLLHGPLSLFSILVLNHRVLLGSRWM